MIDHTHVFTRLLRLFLPAILISSLPAGGSHACPLELPTTSISINGHVLLVEWAATNPSRVCGLSNRAALKENHGMLFVYPKAGIRSFWMKNTHIPLSIAFMDDSGSIINIEIMSPDQTETRYRSGQPSRYALEVNQGWFGSRGIKAGDRVVIKPPAAAVDSPIGGRRASGHIAGPKVFLSEKGDPARPPIADHGEGEPVLPSY